MMFLQDRKGKADVEPSHHAIFFLLLVVQASNDSYRTQLHCQMQTTFVLYLLSSRNKKLVKRVC